MDQKELKRYLKVIKRAVALIEGMMEMDDDGLLEKLIDEPSMVQQVPVQQVPVQQVPVQQVPVQQVPVQQVPVQQVPVQQAPVQQAPVQQAPCPAQPEPVHPEEIKRDNPSPAQIEARKDHVKQLMDIDCWPEAVQPAIAEREPSDEDQTKRANSVLDTMLTVSAEGMKLLDFGCGEGWIAQQAIERGCEESYGYDIESCKDWSKRTNTKLYTDNWGDVPQSYFDFVMLYDVLDHTHDPVDVMNKVKSCLKPDGRVYIRCHPWTAKHSSHLYKKGLNKAFVHLFLRYDEIKEIIGEDPMFVRPEINPIEAYSWWFNEFEVVKQRVIREPISDFFHVPAFKDLLSIEQDIPPGKDFDDFMERLELQFVDYELANK